MGRASVIGVVVVTHESGRVLEGLLDGLREHEPAARVVVVDSASPSGPPAVDPPVEILALKRNVGFGTACNRGVAALRDIHSDIDVVVCLNPDVRLQGPSLTQLAGGLLERPVTGVATGPVVDGAGARVASAWGPTSAARAFAFGTGWDLRPLRSAVARLLPTAGGVNTSGRTLIEDDVLVDGFVLGGAMAVTTACWDAVGGFDERYFLFWEDADLCKRARDAGYEVRTLPATPFVHVRGTSSDAVLPEQRWRWYVEGARLYAATHLTARRASILLLALRVGRSLGRMVGSAR